MLKIIKTEKNSEGHYKSTIEYLSQGERFYPDGKGGQIGDLGKVGEAKVLKSGEDFLVLDRELSLGEYSFEIDIERRKDAQANHSGEHLFSALAFLKYGWRTVGFRMSEKYCTLDFDRCDITEDQIYELEEEVNKKIDDAYKLREVICTVDEANELMGERKDVASKITGDIRVISTFPEDFNACGGLHVQNTSEIKMFKILYWEKVKSVYTRFYFISGDRCYKDYSVKHEVIKELCQKFSCQTEELVTMAEKQIEEKKNLEKKLRAQSEKYADMLWSDISKKHIEVGDIKLFSVEEDASVCERIRKNFIEMKDDSILLTLSENSLTLSSQCKDVREILNKLKNEFSIKGGGTDKFISAKGEKLVLEELKQFIKALLEI